MQVLEFIHGWKGHRYRIIKKGPDWIYIDALAWSRGHNTELRLVLTMRLNRRDLELYGKTQKCFQWWYLKPPGTKPPIPQPSADLRFLGLDLNASQSDIRRRYRRLAKRYHPDHHGGSKESFYLLRRHYLAAMTAALP